MLLIISPSKTQTLEGPRHEKFTLPAFRPETEVLVENLRRLDPEALASLMDISANLAQLNWHRFQQFSPSFDLENARQAILAFQGDVYSGVNAAEFSPADLQFAQDNLRILSGLYGVLRPLDLIQPYRLEMKTGLATERAKNLYAFWGNKISGLLNNDLENVNHSHLVNLASREYFKAAQSKNLRRPVLEIVFKTGKNGQYRVVAIHAKKARGMMVNFVVRNRLTDIDDLKQFTMDRYSYNAGLSSKLQWVFCKEQE
jgi:cytoplasmic iron level regulating protein YaaA (DUF328/UPF0246 family)